MYQSANQWATGTFQYEEYDPNKDMINLDQLQKDQSNNNDRPSGPRFVQANEEDDNQLALEVGDDQQHLSVDILNKIGDKINKADDGAVQAQIKKQDTLKVEDYNDAGGAGNKLQLSMVEP